MIDRGRIVLDGRADELRGVATAVSGPVHRRRRVHRRTGWSGTGGGWVRPRIGRGGRRSLTRPTGCGPDRCSCGSDPADIAATGRACRRRSTADDSGKDKRMKTWRDVARYHLVMPWAPPAEYRRAILACSFTRQPGDLRPRAGWPPQRRDEPRPGLGARRLPWLHRRGGEHLHPVLGDRGEPGRPVAAVRAGPRCEPPVLLRRERGPREWRYRSPTGSRWPCFR